MAIQKINEGISGAQAADIIYENDTENAANIEAVKYQFTGEDITGALSDNVITTAGSITAHAGFSCTGSIPVTVGESLLYKGKVTTEAGATGNAVAVYGYGAGGALVGAILGAETDTLGEFVSFTIPSGVITIRACSRKPHTLQVMRNSDKIQLEHIEGIGDIAQALDNIAVEGGRTLQEVYKPFATNGYVNASGAFVASANWRATDYIPVLQGDQGIYTGYATSPVVPLVWFDENKENPQVIISSSSGGSASFTIPADGFIRASYKAQEGDVQSLKVPAESYNVNPEANSVPAYVPKISWALQGSEFRMYPLGITPANEVIFDKNFSSYDFLRETPENANDISVGTFYRNGLGALKYVGNTTFKVTGVPVSPSSTVYVQVIGNSLTQAGVWTDEFSRRLTGVGNGTGFNDPAALNLSNIQFIGGRTSPSAIVPREGNGGWAVRNWLNNQNFGGNFNRFWNPATEKFDLNYYITQMGYTGINASGSNLVFYIECLWNSVYTESLSSAILHLQELIDRIGASRSAAKIKILGLQTPPLQFLKEERGMLSQGAIMRDIIKYNEAIETLCDDNANAEFIAVSPFFHPDGAYPSVQLPVHLRAGEMKTYYTDYVHPNNKGYGQLADCAVLNFLYNYCR